MFRTRWLLCALLLAVSVHAAEPTELILVPVFYGGGGQFQSEWNTELAIYNDTDHWIKTEDGGALTCNWLIDPCPYGSVASGEERFRASDPADSIRGGFLLRLPSDQAEHLVFSLRAFDVFGATGDMGIDVPVVREREFRADRVRIPNVPLNIRFTPLQPYGFREMLRVYAIGNAPTARARVNVWTKRGGSFSTETVPFRSVEIELTPSGSHMPHWYAEESAIFEAVKIAPELGSMFSGSTIGIRVEIEPITPGLRWWGFVSITNNMTQQVSIVTAR